ncbi:unnamed protein product [Moneuplotes crassus]|uniref:F-box domain-containing protein n=1 Tax=Euplotes crassus TaxID=5936 RepID=A0AAD2DBG6_EUPCR|nr:unnamed protein product [Moneuplotes crassus]
MKLQNITLREILLFLEYQDLADNRLEFVSKKFYHNIMEDNELLRRMLDNYLGMIKDYQREQEYHDSILNNRRSKEQENSKEEMKEPERKYIKLYDDTNSNIIRLLKSLFRESNKLMVICERTTGGHQRGCDNIQEIFQDHGDEYNACPDIYFPNGLMCITALPYSEDPQQERNKIEGVVKAKELGRVYLNKTLEELEKNSRHAEYEFGHYSYYSYSSDSDEEVPENAGKKMAKEYSLKSAYKVLEDTAYKNPNLIAHDKGFANKDDKYHGERHTKIVEFDTTMQREISRDRLFMLTQVEIRPADCCTCNIKAFAVFVHDYPVVPEDHPLTTIVKVLYDSLEWNGKEATNYVRQNTRWMYRNESDEEDNEETKNSSKENAKGKQLDKSKATPAQEILAAYSNAASYGIIPKISHTTSETLEFSQKFYSKKSNFNTKEEFKMDVDRIISKLPKSSEYLPVMESLDMTQVVEDYNYRLAAIAYDLDTSSGTYQIKMPENAYGRYITILGLDTFRSNNYHCNFDIGKLVFSGFQIPSCLKFVDE